MRSVVAVLSRSRTPDPEAAQRMLSAAPHRGRLTRLSTLGGVVLGVSHADGIGTSDISAGPQLAAAFSGCFDNLDPIAAELERGGESVAERTPAAVLRSAFKVWGKDAPRRLRGAFTGIVTDGHTIWAFRDHLGFQPLSYRNDQQGVFVATEVKQVLAGAGLAPEPDLEVVEGIFYSRTEAGSRCALRGAQRLAGATLLEAGKAGVRLHRYYDPEPLLETARLSARDLQDRFDELMTQAVGRTLVGRGLDVLSLSGGIDSPAIAAYAAPLHLERTGEPLPCLSQVYPKYPSVDESEYITAVAGHFDLPLHTFESRARSTDGLLEWVRLFDSPVPVVSLSETHEDLSRARERGYRNMLTGEFAEFTCDLRTHLLPHLLTHGRVAGAWRHLNFRRSEGASLDGLTREVLRALAPPTVLSAYRRLRGRPVPLPQGPAWIDSGKLDPWPVVSSRRGWRELQLVPFGGAGLSIEANELIQAVAGVSVRRPWADIDLWEFFLSLPAEVKFPAPRSKALVRSLLRGKVPDIILDRRYKTFFDDAILSRIDYPALRGWLLEPDYRVDGVDYALLAESLQKEDLDLVSYMWAKDLAGIHAFMSQWSSSLS